MDSGCESLWKKMKGKPYLEKLNARFDGEGTGNRVWLRYCDTHRRKGEKQRIQTSTLATTPVLYSIPCPSFLSCET